MSYDKVIDSSQLDANLSSIADAIRSKASTSGTLSFPDGFISAIGSISGSGSAVLGSISISENGSYSASDYDLDGFADVVVDVVGTDTSDATLSSGSQMLYGVTAYASGSKYTGTVSTYSGAVNSSVSSIGSFPIYSGSTVITPLNVEQSFPTANHIMVDDFVVESVSHFDYSNYLIAMGAISGSVYDSMLTSVGSYAFYSNQFITGVEMPSVSDIYDFAFGNCKELISASFPSCKSLTGSTGNQFKSCIKLESVDLPICQFVGAYAFSGCERLSYISLPNATALYTGAFCSTALQSVYLPKALTVGCFMSCEYLETVSCPSATYIGFKAFYNCPALESLYLTGSSVASLYDTDVFAFTPMSNSTFLTPSRFGSIYVPSSLVADYKAATNWSVYSDRITAYVE